MVREHRVTVGMGGFVGVSFLILISFHASTVLGAWSRGELTSVIIKRILTLYLRSRTFSV